MGAIVGAGIFVVSGLAVDLAGASVLMAVVLAGIVAAGNALSSAQLAAAYPRTGGTYEYGYQLFGPWIGYTAGWMFLVAKLTAAATVALGFGAYLEWLAPRVDPRWGAAAAVVLFTVLVRAGIRRTSRANLVLVTLSVGSLFVFIVGAAPAVDPSRLASAVAVDGGTLRAAALMFFAYTGYARIATLGEEVEQPRITIPRAVIITLAAAGTLYVAVCLILIGIDAAGPLGATGAPLLRAARATGSGWLEPVVVFGAGAAMLGVLLNQILGISRMLFAMGRRSDLPAGLAALDPQSSEPTTAVLVTGAIIAVLTLTGVWSVLITISAFSILVYYGIANASALRLDAEHRLYPHAIAVVGLVGCMLLAASLAPATVLVGLGALVAGLVLRFVRVRAG
jgi:APA family basic amino acid/polyamine antiporter